MTGDAQKALLQWYIGAGADEAVSATPVNRLKPRTAAPAQEQAQNSLLPTMTREASRPVPAPRVSTAASANVAVQEARALADKAQTLDQLKQAVLAFNGCALKKTATNTVFSDGDPSSGLMLIGEAPGADEDKQGIPFCGVSGKLLDQMFAAIGHPRGRFYITNTLFWRPPGNRPPTAEELAMCEPFVQKHIALANPKRLILIGGTSAKSILGLTEGVTKLRGRDYSYSNIYLKNKEIPVRVTFHPSYLLRQPAHKKQAWEDLQIIKHLLAE